MDTHLLHHRRNLMKHRATLARILLAAAPLLINGCVTPQQTQPTPVDTGTLTQPPAALPAEPEQAFDIDALDAVTVTALSEGTLAARIRRNEVLSQGLDATTLALINARLSWMDGDAEGAKQQLDAAATANLSGRLLILQERQQIAELERRWLDAARLAWQQGRLDPDRAAEYGDQLFANLMHMQPMQLQRAQLRRGDSDWQAWLTLASAYLSGREAVLDWINQHPNHLAVTRPPAALAAWLTQKPPAKIGVLLPLSGRLQQAGEAVLNGIVEGLFRQYRNTDTRPGLITVDTATTADAITAYRRALSSGVDFVIGPLTREAVERATRLEDRPVPQLALNRPAIVLPENTENWASISLSPEDEAKQLATLAFGDGLRRAVIVRPATAWGYRMEAALVDRWRRLGGQITAVAEVTADTPATEALSTVLGAAGSERRIRAMEDAFAAPVSARARRRGDMDVIFLLVPDPATARELRPLLVFHYAGDVPVYGPSSVYSGNRQSRNQDLNGLVFVETPAVINAARVDRFSRLRALGADAVLMVDHWDQTQASATARVSGQSGQLFRDTNGNVRRELTPTRFDGDQIRPLPVR